MEDHRLKAFCLVVELKSFSKAAEAKFMTQSAMSHLIKNLEDELGVKLLNRHSKTVSPTHAGRLFYDYAKKILEQYKKMENDVYNIVRKIKGPLHIGASTTAAAYLLPQVFYSFSKNYPEVRIDLTVSNTEKIINDINEGRADIGIVEGNIKNPGVLLEDIAEDEVVIIASDDNPLTKKKLVTPYDIMSQPFIMPEIGSGIRAFIDDFFRALKINSEEVKVAMTLGNTELIIQMAQAGMGISFVSKWAVFEAIKDGSIKLLNIANKRLKRKFYLVGLDKEPPTAASMAFARFVKGYKFFIPF